MIFLFLLSFLICCVQSTVNSTDGLTRYSIRFDRNRTSLTFLVLAFGTRGDIQPVLELCRILEGKGNRCFIASSLSHEKLILESGFAFLRSLGNSEKMRENLAFYAEYGMSSFLSNLRMPRMMAYFDDLARGANSLVLSRFQHSVDVVMAPNWVRFGGNIAEFLGYFFSET